MLLSFYNLIFALLFIAKSETARATRNMQVEVKPHPEDVRSKREADNLETDVATPLRLSDDLAEIASSNHFRTRRSVSSDINAPTLPDDDFDAPTYKLHAFGDDLVLRLEPDRDLIAPAYVMSSSWKNFSRSEIDSSNQAQMRNCFYKGVVVGHPASHVGVSLCGSMTGSFSTNEYHYFIGPLAERSVSGEAVSHSVQRRSVGGRSKRTESGHSSACGVNESRHRRRYEQTFKPYLTKEFDRKIANVAGRTKRSSSVIQRSPPQFQNVIDFELEPSQQVKSRTKRSFDSRQHYIETMVVADASMLRHHGDDLEHYILSIMMVANGVFSHPSLGSAITLSVVKVLIIDDQSEGPRVSTNAAHTLRNFCSWQRKFNTDDDSDPSHYDLAILLTKTDLCGDTCDTLGMAEVGAMCSSRRSCAVVEDDGLSSSYTIAHEVGHVLNMMHDDNRLCRANFAYDSTSHIMSSTMERVDSAQPWSLCSKQAVMDFLDQGRGSCLLDKPQRPKVYPRDLPGAMYDVDAQCEMSFGSGAVECPYMRECSRLWCQIPRGSRPNQCHTKNFPRADGSPCAPGSHCMQGQCVAKQSQRPPIDGEWSSWSQFGSCSRSCGGGIQMSTRQCSSPAPKHGGRYCIGSRRRFQSCMTQLCRSKRNTGDFRGEQCASYNGQRFPALGVYVSSTWIPKYLGVHAKDRCKLICQSEQTGTYVTLSDRVIDGTRCGPDTTNVCVRGQCMPAGCDGALGSKAKFNKCGLCKLSNKHCRRVKGKYNRRQSGYSDVVTLPKGAATIRIKQRGYRNQMHDGNYLALVNSAGNYLLNGDLTLSTVKKDIAVNGTVLQYSGVQVSVEKINSTMPLKAPVTLQVLSLGISGNKILPPKITYSYYIPKPRRQQTRKPKTRRPRTRRPKITTGRTSNGNLVTRRRLRPEPPRSTSRPTSRPTIARTRRPQTPRWVTGRWAKCKPYQKRKCGPGWKKRRVTCKIGKQLSNRCSAAVKPYHRLPCFVASCPRANPVRRRHSSVGSRRNNGPSVVQRYTQHNERPIWNAQNWGSCSTSCGFGTKRRMIICQTNSGRLLDDSLCDANSRPPRIHGCRLRDCP